MLEAAVFCLALNVYHESRGEPVEGRRMVAEVTMNRAGWDQRKVCSTVFSPSQFSWANGKVEKIRGGWGIDLSLKPTDKKAWAAAQALARTVLTVGHGTYAERGIMFYHTIASRPKWGTAMIQVASIGGHVFYMR